MRDGKLSFYLNESDYFFDKFQSNGMSGMIYKGMPKENKTLSKILVKKNEPQFAANEFFALRIAALLGMPVPKAWFIQRKNEYTVNNKFAVGIEYLEDLSEVTNDILYSAQPRKEFIACNLLHICFSNTDVFQMSLTSDRHIIPFDFAECFHNSPLTIMMLLSNGDNAYEFMRSAIANNDYVMQIVSYIKCGRDSLLKQHQVITGEEFDETAKLFAKKLAALPDYDIIDILTAMEEYYSKEVADYYDLYLGCVQKNIQDLLMLDSTKL